MKSGRRDGEPLGGSGVGRVAARRAAEGRELAPSKGVTGFGARVALGLACITAVARADVPTTPTLTAGTAAPRAGTHAVQAARVSAAPAPTARFALVLGNNRAPHVETLRYADDDALGMHRLFSDATIESVLLTTFDAATRELHPRLAPSGPATLAELEREMAALRGRMQALADRGVGSELYFFFSGHGDVAGGEGRLMLEDHALTRGELHELLAASGASQSHVFLDACSSFLVASKRADPQRRQPVDPGFARRPTPDALDTVGFVLSSSTDRDSHEWERYEAGIVSHELRSGLRGAADADLDGDISYAELAAFLHQANESIDIPRLRPDPFVVPPGRSDWQRPVLRWQSSTVSAAAPRATSTSRTRGASACSTRTPPRINGYTCACRVTGRCSSAGMTARQSTRSRAPSPSTCRCSSRWRPRCAAPRAPNSSRCSDCSRRRSGAPTCSSGSARSASRQRRASPPSMLDHRPGCDRSATRRSAPQPSVARSPRSRW